MLEYGKEEQKKILSWGKNWLICNLGLESKAHRVGGYGADPEIYNILKEDGFTHDSSFFFGSEICHMDYPHTNKVISYKGIFEFPITVYRERRFLCGKERKPVYKKLDFRYGSDSRTILEAVRQSPENSVLTLFMHSCNFLEIPYYTRTKKFGEIKIQKTLILEYRNLLSGLQQMDDVVFTDFDRVQIAEDVADFVFETKKKTSLSQVLKRKIDTKILGKIMK